MVNVKYSMTKIDLEQLVKEIRAMNRTHTLYGVLRDELKKRGFWKYRRRGNPSKGFQAMKQARDK